MKQAKKTNKCEIELNQAQQAAFPTQIPMLSASAIRIPKE